ncbi:hypothetical protein EMA8858_00429 [Emticicia aquatica]|uniref:LamG-like jellyroll fold domain-containing protein n=1 Tax=Emticicia aquatica TaxID=1681835 RepID=A0ABM9AKM3_9BACT|nr:LamG domain-containing protein [Emticicia aquatica]CAH0994320.1 hypothetical protein EMA8858_00429 [Emticicia aquatica]
MQLFSSKFTTLLIILLSINHAVFSQNDKTYVPNPDLFSVNIGSNSFIKGKYLELGISGKGCLVSTTYPPSDYHPHGGSYYLLGMVSDNAKDGWANGNPPQSGDYFQPGIPFEGFKVEFDGVVYENNGDVATIGIPGENLPTIETSTLKKAIWQGETSGKFSIKQTISIGDDNTFATFRIVLKNISSSTANIYYSRTVDPDQESLLGAGPSTYNTIISQYPTDNRSLVRAIGSYYGVYFGMVSNDPRSKVCFTNSVWSLNPSQYYNGTNGAVLSGNEFGDFATALTFNFGNVAPADSVVFEYAFLTNQSDEGVFSCLPTANLSGSQIITTGQTANLTLNLTGTPPWSFVMNGQTFFDISTTPLTIPVTPLTTTTYALSSLSNSCGSGSISGSATITVCSPSEVPSGTISGNQMINLGQTANLSLTFAGSPPWSAVVNGFTLSNINLSPFTLSVAPSSTTVYTLSSVSNSCGNNTTTSSATVSVCSVSTATLSGSQYILAGQTANLSVSLTGISPWTVVMNGQTYNNITSSPFTIAVTPSVTTTYSLTSVSNVCGNGTVSGTPTVTICVPPSAVITGNQTISEGQNANLSVAFTGTAPWSCIINGTNYTNITTNPYVINVSPSTTTTYTLTSVSNPCGTNIASSSATINVTINLNNGLVSCYAFSTNAIDGKGRNNGVNNGATLTTDRLDRPSSAYNFDGNDYIELPTTNITNDSYTYSLWVNPTTLPAYGEARTLLSIGGQSLVLVYSPFYNRIVWNFINYNTNSTGSSIVTPEGFSILANQWKHIVAVKSPTTTKMYIDGVLISTSASNGSPDYGSSALIGKRSGSEQLMIGKIDDIRIYNYAMSDAQITALNTMSINDNCDAIIHNENGLVSCYAFSEDAKDEFSNNHGIVNNLTQTSNRFGNPNNAFLFGGSSLSNVQISNPNPFTNNSYSYAAWVKASAFPSFGGTAWIFTVGQAGVGDQSLYIFNNSGNVAFTAHTYAAPAGCLAHGLSSASGGLILNLNQWYHVVVTMDNVSYNLYVDGKLVDSSPSSCTTMTYGTPSAYIGVRNGGLSPFTGIIDDVRIYNRSISVDEVKSIRYTRGCRTKCPETLSINDTYNSPLPPLRNEANQITGSNIINSNTEIQYDAQKSILLQPGFKVEQGGVFEAFINGCGGNK